MKISKRILGVALALIMIFNVFAVGTFAAFPDDTAVKLMLTTDKKTYAAGEEVVITVSEQVIGELGTMLIGGQYDIAYDSAAIEPVSTSTTIEDHGFTALQGGYDSSISNIQVPSATSAVTLAGTDAAVCLIVGDDFATTFDATSGADLFTFKMKIKDDAADGTYTIGFNPQGYEEMNAFSNDGLGYGGLYGTDASAMGFSVPNMYEYGTVTFTVGAVEEKLVYHVKNQIQWADKDANTVNVGVVAGFDIEDIAINFNDFGTSTDVTAVGAKVTINEKDDTKTERFVYAMNDGKSYYFRAVIENVSADYKGDIVVTPFVEKGNDTFYGDPVTINAAELATLVAKLPA